ncbi:MAG: cbb3-type cytochrome c oxidase subunit II [Leptonema sp. (in: bacteria)]
MKTITPFRLFITTLLSIGIGFFIVFVFSYQLDLNGKFSFTHPPENPSVLKGYEIYYQEGCQYCHTLSIRAIKADISRFIDKEKFAFDPSIESDEFIFFTPFSTGSRRIGPDLSTVSSKYTLDSLQQLLQGKMGSTYSKNYHNYAYLFINEDLETLFLSWRIRMMMNSGLPLSDPYQRSVFIALEDKTKGDVLIDFLMYLGSRKLQYNAKFYQ